MYFLHSPNLRPAHPFTSYPPGYEQPSPGTSSPLDIRAAPLSCELPPKLQAALQGATCATICKLRYDLKAVLRAAKCEMRYVLRAAVQAAFRLVHVRQTLACNTASQREKLRTIACALTFAQCCEREVAD